MIHPPAHPYRVPFDGSFRVADAPTSPGKKRLSKKEVREQLAARIEELAALQEVLYAHDHHAILLIFQAMDAAGKDGTIRAVLSGVNPAGCQVYSFKQPNPEELDHDFLWRTARCLPERGRIGIFNRSYYEEALVVRVHPELLHHQRLPADVMSDSFWQDRFESIADHEKHLARQGTVVIKLWLNISRDEQRARFLKRIDDPSRNWKFAMSDVRERGHWSSYMQAYEEVINATSKPWAPWYAIPADSKPHMRLMVADIIVETLRGLSMNFPELDEQALSKLAGAREALLAEDE